MLKTHCNRSTKNLFIVNKEDYFKIWLNSVNISWMGWKLCLLDRLIFVIFNGYTSASYIINEKVGINFITDINGIINELLPVTSNSMHSFADDRTLHANICSTNQYLPMFSTSSLNKDLDIFTNWRFKNMVQFNDSKLSAIL